MRGAQGNEGRNARDLAKWLTPGIGVKRWISACALGVMAQILGGVMIALAAHRTLRWHMPLELGLVLGGLALFLAGAWIAIHGGRRIVRAVVRVINPTNAPPLVEAFYRHRARRGVRVVAIGGGTGLSAALRGLKAHTDNITAIVAMADDGGSSGRLRAELGVLPPGDVRNCLVALAGEEKLLAELFNYRFRQGGLEGHSFGNLFLTALADLTGDLQQAIRASSRVLAVRGQVLPATLTPIDLAAQLADGTVIHGESRISRSLSPIVRIWCEPSDPPALPDALTAIREADVVILGPGSLYTSIATNLLVPDILAELRRSTAPKIYVCNVMTQLGETDRFTVSDHVRALQAVGGPKLFDYVLVNQDPPQRLRERYEEQGQHPVELDLGKVRELGVIPIVASLIDEREAVRHNPAALGDALIDWIGTVQRSGTGDLGSAWRPELAFKPRAR